MKYSPPVKWNRQTGVAANAERSLPRLAQEYFAAGRQVLAPETTAEQFHAFRLLTKRFRYVLELFVPVYGEPLESRVKALKAVQTYLGDLNDRHTVHALLENYTELRGRERLISLLEQDAVRLTTGFRRHWTEVFDVPGAEEDWREALAKVAPRPPVKRGPRPASSAKRRSRP